MDDLVNALRHIFNLYTTVNIYGILLYDGNIYLFFFGILFDIISGANIVFIVYSAVKYLIQSTRMNHSQ